MNEELIEQSFELAGERAGDITAAVYEANSSVVRARAN